MKPLPPRSSLGVKHLFSCVGKLEQRRKERNFLHYSRNQPGPPLDVGHSNGSVTRVQALGAPGNKSVSSLCLSLNLRCANREPKLSAFSQPALSTPATSSLHPRNQLSASLQPALDGGWAELHTVDFTSRAVTGGCVPVGNVSPSIQWGRRHAGLALSSETPMRPWVPPTQDPVHLLEDWEEGKERSQYCPGLSSQCGGPLPSPLSLSAAQNHTGWRLLCRGRKEGREEKEKKGRETEKGKENELRWDKG